MRLSSSESVTSVLSEVSRLCREGTIFLRDAALVNPKLYSEWEGTWRFPNRLDDLITLSILSWYWDDEISVVFRYELEKKVSRNDDYFVCKLLLHSKESMLEFLSLTTLWTTRSFFGSILNVNNLRRVSKLVKIRWKTKREPTRTVWRRGYKDKGTLRKDVHPNKYVDTTKEHLKLLEERQVSSDTYFFALGYLGEGMGD